ncbi:restriction endonuclease subunit S [Marinobacter sp.]|uniref:restriction endonuclease subunit S n=1 Tax=Marinobacter sp. TaxID=50741 RepID=UPI00263063BB|nr:restriction endonuclease subunit S [Marinobacter sp.]
MVPEGWLEGKVQNFLFLQRGFDLTQQNAELGNVPVYSSSGLSYYHNEAKVKGPGIVTGRKGSVGPVYLVEGDFWPHDTTLWVKDFKGNDIHYIEYFLNYLKLERLDEASSVPTLNRANVHGIKCVFPPPQEQQRIAKILSTWDKVIATTEQLLANSEQQKKALMQQLLTGKKRLPGFEWVWAELALGELFSERREIGISNLPLLSVTSEHGVINRNNVGRKDTSSADKSKYLRVCSGDIAYNTMRMWQGVSALSGLEGIVSPAYTVLQPNSGVDSRFAAYLFKLPEIVHRFYRHSQGLVSDTWNLKYKQFAKIKVFVPCAEEQAAIADVLAREDELLACINEQLLQLTLEKKALMQQLLTGKRRVKLAETEPATA